MPHLSSYGEDRLVAVLLARLPANVTGGEEVITGPGDDCAVILSSADTGLMQLLKTDCVIEGVHYLPGTPPEQVGWKALCRPLSDIAAMGGRPLHALVTLALPTDATVAYAQGIYDGLGCAAERFAVRIVGGETARSPMAGFVSVAMTGEVSRDRLATRSGGKPGHSIYVTGRLGGSFQSGKHLDFVPRLAEAHWLATSFPASAMMDLSDGLGRDLPRLASASGTGYSVDPAWLPLTPGCNAEQAVNDGEDYELLFTVPASTSMTLEKSWLETWPDLELTRIGELTPVGVCVGITSATGYDHFKPGV